MRNVIETTVAVLTFAIAALALAGITGCATTAQTTTATAADVVESQTPDTADLAEAGQELSADQVDELLARHDADGDGWAYVPARDVPPALGQGTSVVPNDQVEIAGTVVENSTDAVEVRLADGRRVRVTTLGDGSVAWHVVGVGVSTGRWQAPENAMLEYGRGVDSRGVTLSLPAPAVRQLERDLAAR